MFDIKYFEWHRRMACEELELGNIDGAVGAMLSACGTEQDSHLPVGAVFHLLGAEVMSESQVSAAVRIWLDGLDLSEYANYYKNSCVMAGTEVS